MLYYAMIETLFNCYLFLRHMPRVFLRHIPFLLLLATPAFADPVSYPCPDSKPCRVITLNDDEMRLLAGQNGILQTAAQARALDLSQYVIYFTNKLQNAPAGEVTKPASSDAKPAAPGDAKAATATGPALAPTSSSGLTMPTEPAKKD